MVCVRERGRGETVNVRETERGDTIDAIDRASQVRKAEERATM